MLSSMMSMTSAVSTTSAVSMLATVGVSELSIMAIVCLIALICLSEVLSASKHWNGRASLAFKMAIFPLCTAVLAITVYKIMMAI